MNVYDHIDANNRKTVAILCAFPVALLVIVFLFSFLLADLVSYAKIGVLVSVAPMSLVETPDLLDQLTTGRANQFLSLLSRTARMRQATQSTLLVYPWMILTAFLWIVFTYRSGDTMILGMARARRVAFEGNRELFRLVENTAVMAGLPTPGIYLIDDESMNAFATGCGPKTASIALTKGIVEKLDKAELQAVIAHELAHIGNRDTRLMQITIEGIGCFIFFGEMLTGGAFRGRRGKGVGISLHVVGFACLVFGYLVAPILRFALSRRREYQADATAAKIIRDPDSLARALSKIALDPKVEVLDAGSLVGNMCIVDPTEAGRFNFMRRLYATHPPIGERIAVLRKMMGVDMSQQNKAQSGKVIW